MRYRLATWIMLAVFVAFATIATRVSAEEPGPGVFPIAVTRVKTTVSDDLADALTAALRDQVELLQGWSLDDSDESMEMMMLSLNCPWPPDATCEKRIADEMEIDRYIWGTIDEQDGKAIGKLRLWQRDQVSTTVELSYSASLKSQSDPELVSIVKDALEELIGGAPKGTVEISAGNVTGRVYIGEVLVGQITDGKTTIVAPAGDQTIVVRAPGYRAASGEVTVIAGETVTLTLYPEEGDDDSSSEPFRWSTRKTVGVTLMGVGTAAAAVGLYSHLKVWSYNKDADVANAKTALRGSICNSDDYSDKNRDELYTDRIKEICGTYKKHHVLQAVFYSVGAVAFGTGLYLMLSDKPQEASEPTKTASKLRFMPSIDIDRGMMSVAVDF